MCIGNLTVRRPNWGQCVRIWNHAFGIILYRMGLWSICLSVWLTRRWTEIYMCLHLRIEVTFNSLYQGLVSFTLKTTCHQDNSRLTLKAYPHSGILSFMRCCKISRVYINNVVQMYEISIGALLPSILRSLANSLNFNDSYHFGRWINPQHETKSRGHATECVLEI